MDPDLSDGVLLGFSDTPQVLRFDRANRHGVVAGATGTGKTVTLQVMAEAFAAAGVPVFAADVKGDLAGIAAPGTPSEKLKARAQAIGLELKPAAPPAIFWDLFGEKGHPVRAAVSEMGPLLLSRLFDLSEAQEGVLTIAFHVADKEGLLLLNLEDLQAMLTYLGQNAKAVGQAYGNVAPATVGALQRQLLTLASQGGDRFFGEPALKLSDLMRTDAAGRGYVNVLAAERLIQSPRLYSTFLLWLMSELFETLPEVGDPERPKLVFFFDEAHLLFRDAPKPLLEKIEQVVRLIRSKGVGIYFVTQNPADIPDTVLAQLGNRVQHALRAYTPAEQKGLRAAAASFRANPAFDTAEAIQQLGVGEALVSTLDENGAPSVVARTRIRPPRSRIGPLTPEERAGLMAQSPVKGTYDAEVDRESAYELLKARSQQTKTDAERAAADETARTLPHKEARPAPAPRRASDRQSPEEAFAKSLLRSLGGQLGRELIRGVLGGLRR
jgi:hypothetical protein